MVACLQPQHTEQRYTSRDRVALFLSMSIISAEIGVSTEAPSGNGPFAAKVAAGSLASNDAAVIASNTALEKAGVSTKPFTCALSVDLGSDSYAAMVKNTLSVDRELRPNDVHKTFKISDSTLTIDFAATDVRFLRSAVGAMCDLLKLAVETLEMFGTEAQQAGP